MDSMPYVPVGITAVAALLIGVWDFRHFRIPNFLTLPLLFSGLLYHTWLDGGSGFWSAMLGTMIGGSILFLPYLMGGIGGGDVKLLAAMGAWLQIRCVLLAFGLGGMLVGIVSVYRLCRSRSLQQSTILSFRIIKSQLLSLGRSLAVDDCVEEAAARADHRDRLIPFGVFFAIGLFVVIGWQLIYR